MEKPFLNCVSYISLADFGLAKVLEDDQAAMSFCGTPEYIGMNKE